MLIPPVAQAQHVVQHVAENQVAVARADEAVRGALVHEGIGPEPLRQLGAACLPDQLDVGHFDVDMAWDSALVAEGGCTVVGIAGVAHGDGL